MNKVLKSLTIGIIAALLPTLAPAADRASPSLHDRLTQDEGLSLVSDGLYAEKNANGASFVATNAAGRLALAQEIRKVRPQMQKRLQANGLTRAEQNSLEGVESLLGTLESAQTKDSQENYGNCQNGALLYARASSYNGTSADAYSVVALDFGPVTPTTNYAEANTDYTSVSDYGSALDAAEASASHRLSCFANSYASVQCPGEAGPAVVAWAYSSSSRPRCFF